MKILFLLTLLTLSFSSQASSSGKLSEEDYKNAVVECGCEFSTSTDSDACVAGATLSISTIGRGLGLASDKCMIRYNASSSLSACTTGAFYVHHLVYPETYQRRTKVGECTSND